jgi:hypothetical protein
VAGAEELGNGEAGDGAPPFPVVEETAAEHALPDPDDDEPFASVLRGSDR